MAQPESQEEMEDFALRINLAYSARADRGPERAQSNIDLVGDPDPTSLPPESVREYPLHGVFRNTLGEFIRTQLAFLSSLD